MIDFKKIDSILLLFSKNTKLQKSYKIILSCYWKSLEKYSIRFVYCLLWWFLSFIVVVVTFFCLFGCYDDLINDSMNINIVQTCHSMHNQFFFLFWIRNQWEEPIETLSNLLFLSLWFTILLLVFSHHNVLFFLLFLLNKMQIATIESSSILVHGHCFDRRTVV